MQTAPQLEELKLMTISKDLELSKPLDAWDLFIRNISKAFEDFKKQFQEFIINEMVKANGERLELIRITNSVLNSYVYILKIIKMSDNGCKLYNEFLQVFVPKKYFGAEQSLAKYFQKKEEHAIYSNILERFQTLFNNTKCAKYPNADKIFEIFAKNLLEEFPNYCYICWERVICQLKEELKSEFPCMNDILRMVKKYELQLPVREVKFLKKLQLID